jgi:hypothetical protein
MDCQIIWTGEEIRNRSYKEPFIRKKVFGEKNVSR